MRTVVRPLQLATLSFYRWTTLGLERKMKSIIKNITIEVYHEAGTVTPGDQYRFCPPTDHTVREHRQVNRSLFARDHTDNGLEMAPMKPDNR